MDEIIKRPPNYRIKCKGAVFQVLSSSLKFRFFLNGRYLSKAKAVLVIL
ncbi:MAG: hypothetical protein IPI63_10995 [Methanothrix sp.]|nr:hypothetical protein [Methanothrix sp.]MBK7387202.1 hypothetical protein [Methanothrix sp.]